MKDGEKEEMQQRVLDLEDALVRAGEELEAIGLAVEVLADAVMTAMPAEAMLSLDAAFQTELTGWQLKKNPPARLIRLLQAWHLQATSRFRADEPEAAARLARAQMRLVRGGPADASRSAQDDHRLPDEDVGAARPPEPV